MTKINNFFKLFIFFIISIILFLVIDFLISKNTNFFFVKKDCFKYNKIVFEKKNYYNYDLYKDCFAIEHKGVSGAYNVYTNEIGTRVGPKENKTNKNVEKIIFLGDSFTYGFGVDYEYSIPGQIDSLTENKYEIINFGLMGYSPSMNYFLLKKYLDENPDLKIKKIFYILDITDVHDESNRWINIDKLNTPVILYQPTIDEIQKNLDEDNKFRAARLVAYLINKNLRNIKKKLENYFDTNIDEKKSYKTFWSMFIYTPKEMLKENKDFLSVWKNDKETGIKNIEMKIINISNLIKEYDNSIDFYITYHPWIDTLLYGQEEFSWENFGEKLCIISKCTKSINFFNDVRKLQNINSDWKKLLYFKNDLHFTKEGNQLYSFRIFSDAF